ncbi:MAG: DUF359 domain-containing protein [Methanomassiliicoccaceae archaeon]|jgi:uncharacterized protein (UPF0218 family)|nr:DUF359 domain-containing protein [Methanomassiliicoccaceae archaeon]
MADIRRSRRIPDENRGFFKEPVGEPITAEDLKVLARDGKLITVGDMVSLTANKIGVRPDIAIYDGMTERREMTEFASFADDRGWKAETAANPAGMITADLVKAIANALSGQEKKMIRVVGEEDLAVIPCILLSPIGTNIVYGWPGKGMMLISNDETIKQRTEELLERTEEFQ